MSTPLTRARRKPPAVLALLTSFLVALSGLFVVPTMAHAVVEDASVPVANATLDWGVKASWRGYIAGGGSTNLGAPASDAPAPYRWGTAGTGSFDPVVQVGNFAAQGSVNWVYPAHNLDITFSNLQVIFDLAADTGTIYGDYVAPSGSATGVPLATFVPSVSTVEGGVVTVSAAAAYAASGMSASMGAEFYPEGSSVDPVSFSFTYEVPATATATTLNTSASAVEAGELVSLTATVAPAAAGSVEFFNGAASLGSAAVNAGVATLPDLVLPVGVNSLTAVFTSSDAAYLGSTSEATTVSVTAPAAATATTTTVGEPAPAAPVLLGDEVTLSATVAVDDAGEPAALAVVENGAEVPAGSVEFFSVAAGSTDRVPLGTAEVVDGVAELTTDALPQGGFTFVAVFTPSNQALYFGSEGATTANYNVIDTAVVEHCAVPLGVDVSAETATASWGWSSYFNSMGGVRTGSGDVSVSEDGLSHIFSNGSVRATVDCAEISFSGTATLTLHGGTNAQQLIDPKLYISADGSGVWTAMVSSSSAGNTVESDGYVTVGSFTGVEGVGPATEVSATLEFPFEGTVPQGTWNANFSDAWPNSFIYSQQPSQQAYYYRTSATGLNNVKFALPLTVDFEWPAVSSTSLEVSPDAPVALGEEVTLTATVAPEGAEGEVEFFDISLVDGETSLGTVDVEDGVATLTTTELVAGGHTFRAEYTSSNGFADSVAATTANFGVVDTAQTAVCAADGGATYTNVTAAWNWSAYSSGWNKIASGNVAVDDETFVLSKGVATVTDDCVSVAFTGVLRVEAYNNFFPTNGQWIELVDPTLTIDSDGNGAWEAGVRTGIATLNTDTPVRTVIAEIAGAEFPNFTENTVNVEIGFEYEDMTAPGTWSVRGETAYTDAWSNAFVIQVPSAIRSFYYASGAGGDVNKRPAPLALNWVMPELTGTVNGLSQNINVLQGQDVTFEAGPFREGDVVSIVVNSDPVVLPSVTVGASGIATRGWTVPADFALGAHSVTFSTGTGDAVRTLQIPFTVQAASTPGDNAGPAAEVCVARGVTGGNLNWGVKESFRNYLDRGFVEGGWSGGSFIASGGSVNVNEGGIGRINFSGSFHGWGHHGALDYTLSNPSIQITGPTSGVLFATVNGVSVAYASLSFSGVAISDTTLSITGASATLTGAGSATFGEYAGAYPAGTALDAVTFSVSLGGEVACDSTTDPVELAKTGADSNEALMALSIAAMVMLLGAGLVLARRRSVKA